MIETRSFLLNDWIYLGLDIQEFLFGFQHPPITSRIRLEACHCSSSAALSGDRILGEYPWVDTDRPLNVIFPVQTSQLKGRLNKLLGLFSPVAITVIGLFSVNIRCMATHIRRRPNRATSVAQHQCFFTVAEFLQRRSDFTGHKSRGP